MPPVYGKHRIERSTLVADPMPLLNLISTLRMDAETLPMSRAGLVLLIAVSGCAGFRPNHMGRHDVIQARQLSQQGLDALHRQRYDQAEACFLEAIQHCPTNSTARYQLANCLWKRGARKEAIAELTEALQLSGDSDLDMVVELGYMHANVGNLDQAVKIADHAIEKDPHNALVWQLRGDALHALGRHREALASFQRSLAYDAEDARVLLATAKIYSDLSRPDNALAAVNQAETIIPEDYVPESLYVLKSEALQALQRNDEAVQILVARAQRKPLSGRALASLAEAQLASGHFADAADTLQQAESMSEDRDSQLARRLNRLRRSVATNQVHAVPATR